MSEECGSSTHIIHTRRNAFLACNNSLSSVDGESTGSEASDDEDNASAVCYSPL